MNERDALYFLGGLFLGAALIMGMLWVGHTLKEPDSSVPTIEGLDRNEQHR